MQQSNSNFNANTLVVAEQSILRLAIENPEYFTRLTRDNFISSSAKDVFEAAQHLYGSGASITPRNVAGELGIKEDNAQSLFDLEIPSEGDFSHWLHRLRKIKAKDNIQKTILNNILPAASTKDSAGQQESEFSIDSIGTLLNTVQENLEVVEGKENILYSAPDLLKKYDGVIDERASGNHYYDTGCYHLNSALTEGFAPGRISTIFGSSGVGKSSYGLHLVNRQINKRIPALYVSLEMDMVATMDRLIAQRHGIPLTQLVPSETGIMDSADYQEDYIHAILEREKKKLGSIDTFYFIEEPGLSLSDIEYYIRYVQRQLKRRYIIVTIDLITMVKEFNLRENKASSYEDAVNAVHELAKRMGVHIVGVVQARRPQTKVTVKDMDDLDKLRPQIEDIKNSSAFEERSRIILSTFRKKFFAERLLEQSPELGIMNDIMEVKVLKQNMGGLPMRYYLFDPPTSLITPYVVTSTTEDPYISMPGD